ncbi:MAG: alcohol dehydrogenase catalytic domain-containing protein [bacterium]|nr:alcohol dehydrogenase catalytic domain-containing protein [bacterium]
MRKIKAAVLWEVNKPVSIEEVTIDDPGEGEVLVKMVANGVCHSDLHVIEGNIPAVFPLVLGHEGAGIVEEVGPGVTSLKPGDHVVLFVAPPCGKCRYCLEGRPTLCADWNTDNYLGQLPGGSKRLHKGDTALNHFYALSCYAEYAVVNQRHAIKIREDAPLDKAVLFSCGSTTGLGSSIKRAGVRVGDTVVVYGCGGVGLSALLGALVAGASKVIAVDVVDLKLEKAREIGADYVLNPSKEDNVAEKIKEITGGGADFAIECSGNVNAMTQAFASIHQGGTCVLVAQANLADVLTVIPGEFILGKTLKGVSMGNVNAPIDIPLFIDLYMAGRLPVDRLITAEFRLDELNAAFDKMKKGETCRSIIRY